MLKFIFWIFNKKLYDQVYHPKYCHKCGKELIRNKYKNVVFDEFTGKEKIVFYKIFVLCPLVDIGLFTHDYFSYIE